MIAIDSTATLKPLHEFWLAGARARLATDARGWLQADDDFLRLCLRRPELSLVAESCPAEISLHQALMASPSAAVSAEQLNAIEDGDARSNFQLFVRFRDELLAAGSLEAYYLSELRGPQVTVPPLFLDCLVATIVGHLQAGCGDAFQVRAAELLFRTQGLTLTEGRLLCADLESLEQRQSSAGLLDVLSPANAVDFFAGDPERLFALDLTHEVSNQLGHGLIFNLTLKHSGLKALAQVLAQWLTHFLGKPVKITPLQKVDDPAWSWHIGLDVQAMRLLNDLYEDRPVDSARLAQLISLFRLDLPGRYPKPIYLGLAMTAESRLKLKPQNLLLNLPAELALLG
ncbi:DUF6352 family protein [Roseateles oligotrophus]|uniref:DUF6352 family protein n=1 Tax=Roseateles oligotrophus TaxID=1769250 RepID=A0ABT2Y964_9BURK|nr:DUF6352 family protein [Roseateles oligotrophus]MCV2366850.1 DUF6352 family protein [Roseateles oligotrophus]